MYVKVTNGTATTYTIGQLRRDNPNTSFPKTLKEPVLASYDVYPAVIGNIPDYDTRTQDVILNTSAEQINGVWTINYSIVNRTVEEIAANDVLAEKDNRTQRNNLLSETDWWASSDLTMTAEQTAYRQALRDITSHANWPHLDAADWPTKP